jgi:hypothetical protein
MNLAIFLNSLEHSACKDYLAARKLIIAGNTMPGIQLASIAIEKYLKLLIGVTTNVKPPKLHLDRASSLEAMFSAENKAIYDQIDKNLLHILGEAFKFRYYDNFNGVVDLGFYIGQLLGELDFTVHLIESNVEFFEPGTEKVIETNYHYQTSKKNPDLTTNNYLFLGITKEQFMKMGSPGYVIRVDPSSYQYEIEQTTPAEKELPYDGKMFLLRLDPKQFKPEKKS